MGGQPLVDYLEPMKTRMLERETEREKKKSRGIGSRNGHTAGAGQFRESRKLTTVISTLEKERDRMMSTSMYPFNSECFFLCFFYIITFAMQFIT